MGRRNGLRQLWAYPVETLLIVVALAVGVGAIAAIASLYGVNEQIASRLRADLEARRFTITSAADGAFAVLDDDHLIAPLRGNQNITLRFTIEDLGRVRDLSPTVDHVYAATIRSFFPAAIPPGNLRFSVTAVTPDFAAVTGVEVGSGTWFSQTNFDDGTRVLVITEQFAAHLGIADDPVGQDIPMNFGDGGGAPYTVIGVLPPEHEPETTGGRIAGGYIPYSLSSTPAPTSLFAVVDDERRVEGASEELRLAVERLWGEQAALRPPASTWQVAAEERNRALLLAGFASVGLLMASLNITNLMLARVKRRERSISIQRSIGANKAQIRAEVLTEAAILGLIGGLFGIGLSRLMFTALINTADTDLAQLFSTSSFPLSAIVATLVASVLVTMIIGLAPASRAASTNIVPNATDGTDLVPKLPRPLRRNPARLALTAVQLVISGAAIVIGLHILTIGNATKPEVVAFTLDAVNEEGEFSPLLTVFTPKETEHLQELAPSVTHIATWDPDFSPGYIVTPGQDYAIAGIRQVGPDYLRLVGANVIAGTTLSGTANASTQDEILLEKGVAEQLFTTANSALGEEITLRRRGAQPGRPGAEQTYTVQGIYTYAETNSVFGPPERVAALANPRRDGSHSAIATAPPAKANQARSELVTAARTSMGNSFTRPGFETSVLDFTTETMHDQAQLQRTLNQATFLFTLMAITAIILAAVGTFSLSILNTTERTKQIGIQRALGASRSQIARDVAGSAAAVATGATIVGIAGAWCASPALATALSDSLISGVEIPTNANLALTTIAIVLLTSTVLGWLVGRRATRSSPSSILSEEGI